MTTHGTASGAIVIVAIMSITVESSTLPETVTESDVGEETSDNH
jgi:hypothetical protein